MEILGQLSNLKAKTNGWIQKMSHDAKTVYNIRKI